MSSENNMTSPRKVNANRRNAQRSTGPKTIAGRTRTGRNALKAGLYAKIALLPFEDPGAYAGLRKSVFSDYGPKGAVEEALVELIIADLWRLDRFVRIENTFLKQTELARSRRSWEQPPTRSIECFLDEIRTTSAASPTDDGSSLSAMPSFCHHTNDCTSNTGDATTLLDAYVAQISQCPMEDIARQRRQATRELLRNIAALCAVQANPTNTNSSPRFNSRHEI